MSDSWIGVLVGGGVSAYLIYLGFSSYATEENSHYLAQVYNVSTVQVHVGKKPIDCDFFSALSVTKAASTKQS